MSDKKYREYTREFKLEALELLQRGDKSAGQKERELGNTPGLLVKWRAHFKILENEGQAMQLGRATWQQPMRRYGDCSVSWPRQRRNERFLKKGSIYSHEKAAEVCFHGSP